MRYSRIWLTHPEAHPNGVMINVGDFVVTKAHGKLEFLINKYGGVICCEKLFKSNDNKYRIGDPSYWGFRDIVVMYSLDVKDADGNEVYEGDVVSLPDTDTESVDVGVGVPMPVAQNEFYNYGHIVFRNGIYGVLLEVPYTEQWVKGFNPLDEYVISQMRVIGNAYGDKQILTETT